jgi:hypothetical protein
MFPLIAGMGALSCLSSLLQSGAADVKAASSGGALSALDQMFTGPTQDAGQSQPGASGGGTTSVFDSGTLNALLSLQGQQSAGDASGLLSDLTGDGTIDRAGFDKLLSAGGVDPSRADALFNKLADIQSQLQTQTGRELSALV